MTNDEIKEQIAYLKGMIAKLEAQLVEPDPGPGNDPPLDKRIIIAGPDEHGRVMFKAVNDYVASQTNWVKEMWVLSAITVRVLGRDALTERQFETIRTNVGCDEEGNLGSVYPGLYTNNNLNTGLAKPLKEGWFGKLTIGDWIFADKPTIATRCGTPEEIVAEYKRMTGP